MQFISSQFLEKDALQGAEKTRVIELEAVQSVDGSERACLHVEVDDPDRYLVTPHSWHMCARPRESSPFLLSANVARKRDVFRDPRGEGSVPDSYNFFEITRVGNGQSAFIGMDGDGTGFGEIRFAGDGKPLKVVFERNRMGVTRSEDPPPITVVISNAPSAFVDKNLQGRVRSTSPRGTEIIWFSWPSYGRNIREEGILREAQAAARMPEGARPTTILIDDGHTTHHGDVQMDRDRFPDPRATARRIKELGFKAGIWEPLVLVSKHSQLARKRPDWLVKDRKGKAARVAYYLPTGKRFPPLIAPRGLDISIPEVREHIAGKIKSYEEMGFGVIKLDFMAACFVGEMQDRSKTPLEFYHELFVLINQKLKDETILIGSQGPLMESAGVDLIRATMDSATPPIPLLGGYLSGDLYSQAAIMAERRQFLGPRGVLDGIHLAGSAIIANGVAQAVNPALASWGYRHMFIGDSLAGVGRKGRKRWSAFIERFRERSSDR